MSLEQTAYVERAILPSRAALQAAVDELGFDCKLDESYAPFRSRGFLPCVLNGKESGFEIHFDPAVEILQSYSDLTETVANPDAAITFRWGGDMAECACVLIASAALAKAFGAIVHYQDDNILYSAEQLVEEAKAALQSV